MSPGRPSLETPALSSLHPAALSLTSTQRPSPSLTLLSSQETPHVSLLLPWVSTVILFPPLHVDHPLGFAPEAALEDSGVP